MIKWNIIFLMFLMTANVFAQTTKIKYKKKEVLDFQSLEIEGELITPSEIPIQKRKRKKFITKVPNKLDFKAEMLNSLEQL